MVSIGEPQNKCATSLSLAFSKINSSLVFDLLCNNRDSKISNSAKTSSRLITFNNVYFHF